MCGITASLCVPCHGTLTYSRLENKVTSDAIDWEFPVALRYGLTSSSSAAPSEDAAGFLWNYFNHVKGKKQRG
jgi:hypothetical protein